MKPRCYSPLLVLPLVIALHGHASAIDKQTTGTDLTAGASWVGGTAPGSGDVATWATGSLGAGLTIGSATSWQGIDIQSAATAVAISGAGALTLGSSGINIAATGVDLTLSNSRTFGSTSAVTVGAGRKLSLSGGTTTFAAGTTTSLSGAGTMEFAGGNHTITGSGDFTIGSGFTLLNNLQAGSSSSTYSGNTTLNGGTIIISTSLGSFGTGTLNLNGGKIGSGTGTGRTTSNALNIGGDITVGNTTGGITSYMNFTGAANLGGATRAFDVYANGTLSGNGSGFILNGVVSNGGITLNSTSGTGIMTLGNNGNTFAGATIINAGNLAVSLEALEFSSSVTLNGTGKLSMGLNGTTLINNLSGASGTTIRTDFTISGTAGARTLKVNQSTNGTYAGSFAEGTGGRTIALLKSGTAALTLSGTGGYTGGTILSQGTLVAANSSALGASGTVTINDADTGSNNTTLNIDATAGAVTIARAINVANQGSGTVTLGSSSTGGANAAVFSGAITLAKDVTLNGGSAGDRFSTTGGISGTGNVAISGTNRVVFAGAANSYNGSTTINSNAILQLSDGTADTDSFIPDSSAVTVNSGGFLKLAKGGNSETIGALTGTGTVEAISGSDTLIVGSGDATSSFGGELKNNGGTLALTKTGTGTLTLSGTSTYTGATTINAGTLLIGTSGSLGNTVVTVGGAGATGTPTLAGGGTIGGATTIAAADGGAPGTHSVGVTGVSNGVGTQTFSGTLNYGSGSIFEWNLEASGASDPGDGASNASTGTYDKVTATGALSGSGAEFKIVLGGNTFGDAFWDTNKSWTDVFSGAGAGSWGNVFSKVIGDSIAWNSDTSRGEVSTQGYFTVGGSSLNWTAVPEVSNLLVGGLLGAGLLRRRRKAEG